MVRHGRSRASSRPGAWGRAGDATGLTARFFPIRARHTAVERFELDTGLTIETEGVAPGQRRSRPFSGRCGQVITLANPGPDTVRFSFYRPQTRHGARGYFGGHDGKPGNITLNGEELDQGVLTLLPGDQANLETPGGEGFGHPDERDIEAVPDDVRQGYVSGEAARLYGGALISRRPQGRRSVELPRPPRG